MRAGLKIIRSAARLAIALALVSASTAGRAQDWSSVYRTVQAPAAAEPPAQSQPQQQPQAAQAPPARRNAKFRGAREAAVARSADSVAAAAAAPPPAAAAGGAQAADVARGEELVRNGDIANAAKIFEARAVAEGTPQEQSSTLFRIGMKWQTDGSQLPADKRIEARHAAVSAYERTLQLNPQSGAALNNLAQLYRAEPSREKDADVLLQRAIALNDSRKTVYLLNRAALKRDTKELDTAADLAQQVANADKWNPAARSMLEDIALRRDDAGALLKHIAWLDSQGLVVSALDTATAGIARFPQDGARLLTSVARTLSGAGYTPDPAAFANTDAGRTLAKLTDDPSLGAGVRELFEVLREPQPFGALDWWHDGFDPEQSPAPGSRAEAMQNLARRCGDFYRDAEDKRSEPYYQLAVAMMGKRNPDPRAIMGLAGILNERHEIDALTELLRTYTPGLLETKGRTIAAADFLHTYQLRLALGMMYGYVERWKSPGEPFYAGSIWMLEQARESAYFYNQEKKLPAPEQLRLPPDAVKMLSLGRLHDNDLPGSVRTRLDAASDYARIGQLNAARRVLDEDWQRSLPADLDAGLRRQLDAVKSQLGI